MTSPARTVALVVGISEYPRHEPWMLPGPVPDAVRITDWLLRRGVLPENIHLLLSPAPPAVAQLIADTVGTAPAGAERCVAAEATQGNVQDVLTRTLSNASGDVLFVYWAGHGMADRRRVRRLLFADAAPKDLRNIPLDNVLDALRSDNYTGLGTQIICLDSCATAYNELAEQRTLGEITLSFGIEQPWRQQRMLAASSYAQSAVERGARGVFTTALLEELEQAGTSWPPDADAIMARIHTRFDPGAGGIEGTPKPTMWRFVGANTYASEAPAPPASPLRTAPPRSEVLRRIDRDLQAQAFGKFFTSPEVARYGDRPHAVIVYGHKAERHHSLMLRVVSDQVQEIARAALGVTAKPPIRLLPWPDEGADADDLKDELVRSMFVAAAEVSDPAGVTGTPPAADEMKAPTAAALLRRLGLDKEPLVVLHQNILVAEWNEAQRELLRWYLDDFWHPAPAVPGAAPTPHVLLFLKVLCDGTLSQPSIRSLLALQLTPKRLLRRDLLAIAGAGHRGCRRAILNELEPVPFKALESWFINQVVDTWMTQGAATQALEQIFTRGGRRVERLPMAEIETALEQLLDPSRKAS